VQVDAEMFRVRMGCCCLGRLQGIQPVRTEGELCSREGWTPENGQSEQDLLLYFTLSHLVLYNLCR
jgi:hypothetical protein